MSLPDRVVLEVSPMSSEGRGSIGDSRSYGMLAKRPSVCLGVRDTRLSYGPLTSLMLRGSEGDVLLHLAKAGCCISRESICLCHVYSICHMYVSCLAPRE